MAIQFFTQLVSEATQSAIRHNSESKERYEKAKKGIETLEEKLTVLTQKRESIVNILSVDSEHPRIKKYDAKISKTNTLLSGFRTRLQQLESSINEADARILINKLQGS